MTFNSPENTDTGKKLLLVLSQVPGLGPARINTIIRHFSCSPSLFQAGTDDLARLAGIGRKIAESAAAFFRNPQSLARAAANAERQIELVDRLKADIVTIDSPLYPPLLKEIYDPPPCLFVRGDVGAAHQPCVAVVGTRKASLYGRKTAELLCKGLAAQGFTIVSGFAYGIDMIAHRTTLEHNGRTIAFLAGGVDNPHTDPSGKLWPGILEKGALLSEEWIGSSISPGKFPRRNRLIAGVSRGTVVIESDLKGGSLVTAYAALDQNREVFAVPGSIFSRTSAGTNRLIDKGHAKLVTGVDDIIAELIPSYSRSDKPAGTTGSTQVSGDEKTVLDHLDPDPIHIDLLAEKTSMDPSVLLVHLFELELKRCAEQLPGQMFRKTN